MAKLVDIIGDVMATLWYDVQPECVICFGREGPVCPTCREIYFLPETARCPGCGKIMVQRDPDHRESCHPEGVCLDCREGRGPESLAKVTALGHFHGGWRDFIHKVKYRRNPQLLTLVADEASRWAIQNLPVPDIITAAPMHVEKIRERGFNQAEVLASLLAWNLTVPYRPLLRREAQNVPQMGLDRQGRLENLAEAIRLHSACQNGGDLRGRVCWLVDDVTTTGATLEQSARTLLAGGAREVYGFCLGAAMAIHG
ncbi:MAG: ComF family protein [Peptococcaceae bacterium]|nr:ComF family protein [Peptococcaceae bacterium]